MASKLKDIIPLSEQKTKEIALGAAYWTAFLKTAGWNYKYPFHDQVLIYAQRPDATACAPIDLWNKRFKRWVKKGSKGVALIDDSQEKLNLRYVFDISDTFSKFGNEVRLWKMEERFQSGISETLTNSFGTVDGMDIPSILLSTAENAAADHYTDYLENLLYVKEQSFLRDMDEFSVRAAFRDILKDSISYMLLTRCGYDASMYISHEDFLQLYNFNTIETISILGTASSDISEMILREIESTIKGILREERITGQKFAETKEMSDNEIERTAEEIGTERGEENEYHIQTAGRLSAARTDTDSRPAEYREIRDAEENISEESQESILLHPDADREADGTFGGNRSDGAEHDGTADYRNGTESRADRSDESEGSDDLGRDQEQHSSGGRRTDSERPDLQLTPSFKGGNDEKALPPFLHEELLNELFCCEQHLKVKRSDVIQYFKENTDAEKRAEYIKNIYDDAYTELLVLDGQRVGYKKEEQGLLTWKGSFLSREEESLFSWGVVQEFISNLIEQNLYFPALPLPKLKTEVEQMSLFGMDAPKMEVPKHVETFSFSQEVIDIVIASGANNRDSILRICAWFRQDKDLERNAAFLREEFGNDGKGFFIGDEKITAKYDFDGIHIAKGTSVERANDSILLTWKQVSIRIRELLDAGRFTSQETLDQVNEWELRDIANDLYFLYREEFRNIPSEYKMISLQGKTYDAFVTEVMEKLKDGDWAQELAENISGNDSLMMKYPPPFRIIHEPEVIHERVLDLLYVPVPFRAEEGYTFSEQRNYISDDEIDRMFVNRGSGVAEGKMRIYTYFMNEHTEQEKAAFLRNEYGTGGYSGGVDSEDHDSKGITYSRRQMGKPYDTIKLSWNQAAKRIDNLIVEGRYLSQKELEYFPEYEMKQLSRSIYGFYAHLPSSVPKPYPIRLSYDEIADAIRPQLDDREAVQKILSEMASILDGTATFDRHYDSMKKAYETLQSYDNGTYALIGTRNESPYPVVEENEINAGMEFNIDGRKFVVDSVDYTTDRVSLKDITFQENTGFPIFRSESIDFIRRYLEQEKEELTPHEPKMEEKQEVPPPETILRNYQITDDAHGTGGAKEKFQNNVAAICTLQVLEETNRLANPAEQEILSKYVGWGGLAQAFDENNTSWSQEYRELQGLLTVEEYVSARESTLNAYYTSPVVIRSIYQAIENMGFRKGNILEPACGIGNFFGMLPESMQESRLYGVELDSITGRIAQQLYQKNNIAVCGFEETNLPDSFFDVAVGNVPFGSYKVLDRRYDKHNFFIHDYFFAKTIDKVRPGGVIAFVTSKGTMDKKNSAVRKYIAQRADLLGAIRLPNTAFKANAGTEVTADIIFLQKRDRIIDIEPAWVHIGEDEQGIPMNQYFLEHPEMILGEMVYGPSLYGNEKETTCEPIPDADLGEQLSRAITFIQGEINELEFEEALDEELDQSIPADPNIRNFSYAVVDGKLYYRENSRMNPVNVSVTAENRIRGMIGVRDSVRKLIEYQTEEYPDSYIQEEQKNLNTLYDSFTAQYGLLNSRGNNMAFSQDSSYPLLCSLEILDEHGQLKSKADMFTKRTIKPNVKVDRVDTASEALAVSLAEKACVDMELMSKLTGKEEQEIYQELKGVIFLNPMYGYGNQNEAQYLTADEYLSGNVREKLALARQSAETNPEEYFIHVEALEKVQPEDLKASEISVKLGSTWLPADVPQDFMYELLDTGYYARSRIKVLYSKHTGEWNVTAKSADRGNVLSENKYGTERINAYKIIEETLNQKDVRIFDTVVDADGNERRVLNKKQTAIAQNKQEIIKQAFKDWVWQDAYRRERLVNLYNEKFNSIRPREYDGSHIRFSGMNPEITLRKHQIDAIAHILYGGNTLLAHEVGAGKTYEMVAAAMESKRLGLCAKTLVVVPNHITEQFAAEWLQLYPAANILVATKKDFETKNRRKFCGRIATGDYDAVIIGHSQLEKIPVSVERQKAILQQQIDEIVEGIREAKASRSENYTIKQMEKTRKSLKVKLDKLNDQSRKDNLVTFEELGCDRLMVDEAHYFKNLFLVTKMRNVSGIAQTEAQKSSDLFMKCRYLDELTEGRGIVFATGTPISNSMVELYTMQRYLQYGALAKMELQHFDAWASTFGETTTAIELAPEGTGYRAKTRFSKFYNLPELMSMFKCVADIQTADMLNLPVPQANFHTEVIKPTEIQKEMVTSLAERAEEIRAGNVDPTVDNMLKITNDGRKLALDQRLINPILPDDETTKLSICADNVFRIWEESKEQKSAQLVFCDLSTPSGKVAEESAGAWFSNAYDDVKQKLIEKGIPAEEIAFIHEANSEAQKKELFGKVRRGDVRVLMGSTQKMGAGTNVQNKLIALHDLDCPWRPADLQQRLGRIVRQGNENSEVEIFRYVTEGTFDSYLYQLVENKQKFIAQIMTSKAPVRAAEDVDETALSYAEIKALATGNPLIIEKSNLEMEVGKLNLLKGSHQSQQYDLEDKVLKYYPKVIKQLEERIEGYQKDLSTLTAHTPTDKDVFPPMTVMNTVYTEKADAGKALIGACYLFKEPGTIEVGTYRGFQMELTFSAVSSEYQLALKGVLSHTVVLGSDIHGNITRIDNMLSSMQTKYETVTQNLADEKRKLEQAKAEIGKPFPQEEELQEKTKRLTELNVVLNLDEKDVVLLDGGEISDEQPTVAKKKISLQMER